MPRLRWYTYRVVEAKGCGGIGVADVSSGTDGSSGPSGWKGTVRSSPETETSQSMVGKEGHVPQDKK